MSHIVTIESQVRDPAAVCAACNRLRLPSPTEGTFQLYSSHATGLGVQLPAWRYPVVCDTAAGKLAFDNFGGRWGEQSQLDNFLQSYAVEKAKLEARRRGHTVVEQSLADGSIKLTVQVAGGAV
ncbi:MAG: DUF1257 domain-containing protein [Planctomycetia bacterium]|nr:DUF1257 domain-containing protein [Planctomycetia bacterium]